MLTVRQQSILNFICTYPHPYPPTVRDICQGVGLKSSSTVHRYLQKLEQMGYIERRSNSPRCITVKVLNN